MTARFDDVLGGTAFVFGKPDRVLVARRVAEVAPLVAAVDEATQDGAWAWGWLAYEAAPAFDPALTVRRDDRGDPGGLPIAYFALTRAPRVEPAVEPPRGEPPPIGWRVDWSAQRHRDAVRAAQAAIAAGEAYQVNLTTRLTSGYAGRPDDLYARLTHAQRGSYNAYLDTGRHVIMSASPELFFRWDGEGVTTRPMKGTVRRGESAADDARARADLLASEKQRAENIMIVDLLRNDVSRLARTGSVRVESLLDVERYETVWQLTSTITARPLPGTSLLDVLRALFPSGSVTGAPKVSAMDLISRLESAPRGVYCGAIGMVAPSGAPFRAQFNVGIRTAVLDRATGGIVYGAGGAVTTDSDPAQEYDELLAKAAILAEPIADFAILETMRDEPGSGPRNLERHLARMSEAARYFGFATPTDLRRQVCDAVTSQPDREPRRVRVLLRRDGQVTVELLALPVAAEHVTLVLDTRATRTSRWTRHKTTRRDVYEAAAARHPRADDVILRDGEDQLLETTRANLAIRLAGRWWTPPLTSGCLPGVERARLVADGALTERVVTATDLESCEALAVVSSLRGWRSARLLPTTP